MQHAATGQPINMQTHYYNESGDHTALRMSGLFTGSNLSLNVTIPSVLDGNDNVVEAVDEENRESTESLDIHVDGRRNETERTPTEYHDDERDIPNRPMSSSDVLERDRDVDTDLYLLRRVYSDTTPVTPPTTTRKNKKKPTVKKDIFKDDSSRRVNTKTINTDNSSPQAPSLPLELDLSPQTNESTLI